MVRRVASPGAAVHDGDPMLTLLLRRVLPGRLIPLLGLWELYTAFRWLNGRRTDAQRRHPPKTVVVSGEAIDVTPERSDRRP